VHKFTRRQFIKITGAATAGAATAGLIGCKPQPSTNAENAATNTSSNTPSTAAPNAAAPAKPVAPMLASINRQASLPNPKGPRVVVVGGGWSGLTIAKYLKREHDAFDVVLIEKRAMFMSCPISNLWLADVVNMEFIHRSFLDAAKYGKYTFFNATVVDVDRESKKIYTDQGFVNYDYLVLAPGIDYEYSSIGVNDPDDVFRIMTEYPAGFMPGSEHISIKNKLAEFEGGVFLLTVPAGNYRCLPGPYERACMVSAIFKKQKIKGKVLLLDANPDITIKKEGFHNAFDQLYKGILEYHNTSEIKSVDLSKRTVSTEFDTYQFDDAAIYPRIRASRLIETLGLVNPESPQKEANIDVLKYHIVGDEHVYVAGDARPMPFSKSGNTANTEGKFVAKLIAAHAQGKELAWESPNTICYSAVSASPVQSISVNAYYKYNAADKSFAFDNVTMFEKWNAQQGQANLEWARGLYRDMFS